MTLQKKVISLVLAFAFAVTSFAIPGQPTVSAYDAAKADKVINIGDDYLHRPYKFGSSSNTTKTFDCSSFTKRVYQRVGITLPRVSRAQAKVGTKVAKSKLKKGDLIFFRSSHSTSSRITHVAIYAGNGRILHTYGKPGVTFSKFKGTNWEKRFVTARRVL